MALRQLAFATPVRTALRSGQRALLSYSTGIPTGILGAATGASGVTPFTSGLAERFSTDSVTAKFGDPSFWEGEYSAQYASQQEQLEPFEWFLPYEGGLRQHLLPFLQSMSVCKRVLHVGCGTSEVGPKLASEPGLDAHISDADASPSAVRIMKARHVGLDNYSVHRANALSLPFREGDFDAVVDKGTLDALLCRSVEDAQGMAAEIHRVLAKGGVFLQVTTEDPEARLDLLTTSAGRTHAPWSKSLFKEIGEGAHSTYFMYVLVK
ncbi:unnamed protein product [Sphacelaria rigidula]